MTVYTASPGEEAVCVHLSVVKTTPTGWSRSRVCRRTRGNSDVRSAIYTPRMLGPQFTPLNGKLVIVSRRRKSFRRAIACAKRAQSDVSGDRPGRWQSCRRTLPASLQSKPATSAERHRKHCTALRILPLRHAFCRAHHHPRLHQRKKHTDRPPGSGRRGGGGLPPHLSNAALVTPPCHPETATGPRPSEADSDRLKQNPYL